MKMMPSFLKFKLLIKMVLFGTSVDVATEMVKELDITDWEPCEIAEMIDGDISAPVPHWNKADFPHSEAWHTFNCKEDDDGPHHPFRSFSSCSSSHVSLLGLMSRGYDRRKGMSMSLKIIN